MQEKIHGICKSIFHKQKTTKNSRKSSLQALQSKSWQFIMVKSSATMDCFADKSARNDGVAVHNDSSRNDEFAVYKDKLRA